MIGKAVRRFQIQLVDTYAGVRLMYQKNSAFFSKKKMFNNSKK